MRLITYPNELHREAHLAIDAARRALDDVVQGKLPPNPRDVLVRALVVHGGRAGDDGEVGRRERRELRDDLVGHRVAEVLLAGIPLGFASGSTMSLAFGRGARVGSGAVMGVVTGARKR